jgi:catechol 2,3-dioxygenase-like lactoylglutathione lyase family enzyme
VNDITALALQSPYCPGRKSSFNPGLCVVAAVKLSFDAVFYYVRDLDTSVDFYHDKLGLRLISRDFVARFDINGVLFELVPAPGGRVSSGASNARLCFRVDDIGEAVHSLTQRGVPTTDVKPKAGGLLAFFNDPDGNELCVWQYTSERLPSAGSGRT